MKKNQSKEESRLMGLKEAAKYLGVSYWTVREIVWSGALPMVKLPNKNGGQCRKILIDRRDLDGLIEKSKESFS
jgi:excisionase family DNA binding protein